MKHIINFLHYTFYYKLNLIIVNHFKLIYIIFSLFYYFALILLYLITNNSTLQINRLPSIDVITTYFNFKVKLFNPNNFGSNKDIFSPIKDMHENLVSSTNNYIPNANYTSYFPTHDMKTAIIPYQQNDIVIDVINCPDYTKDLNKPIFEISNHNIEKVIVTDGPLLNSDLPFETPIELKVSAEETDTTLIVLLQQQNSILKDQLDAILSPSFEGARQYSDDQIFSMHIKIIQIITQDLESHPYLDETQAQQIIRDAVKKYMTTYNLYGQLTTANLKNTNFLINLLVKEMIVNSLFVTDYEKFILENVIKALLFEVLSNHYSITTDELYDDTSMSLMKNIISRFL